jgi:hypothetical protein
MALPKSRKWGGRQGMGNIARKLSSGLISNISKGHPSGIFFEGHTPAIMQTCLDAPMSAANL